MEATATEPATREAAKKGERPVIWAPRKDVKDENSPQIGLILWPVNSDKEKAPHFSGFVSLEGSQHRVFAYIRTREKNGRKFLSLTEVTGEGDNQQYNNDFGIANAVNREKNDPLAADAWPYVIAAINENVVRGNVSAAMSDEMMKDLGFGEDVIRNFRAKLAKADELRKPAAAKL